jgi:hypothetical protein
MQSSLAASDLQALNPDPATVYPNPAINVAEVGEAVRTLSPFCMLCSAGDIGGKAVAISTWSLAVELHSKTVDQIVELEH